MNEHLELPKDMSLPFLVYGIFKPKSISKSIESENKYADFENMGFIEDIVPLTTKNGNNKNDSYLMYFDKDHAKKAYENICKMESSRSVKWKKIKVGGVKANVLLLEDNDSYYLSSEDIDTTLPFFAYGIFKKNQLAYSKIKEYVEGEPQERKVDYEMLIRDGVPILTKKIDSEYKASGHLIKFKADEQDEAYDVISQTESKKLYKWDVIDVKGKKANVLIGKDSDRGSSEFEIIKSKVKNYNGKNDPFFNETMKLIEEFKETASGVNVRYLLELQMHYLLLWAAIERYCDLKYGKEKISENLKEFAEKEEAVINSIENLNLNRYKSTTVFSAKDLRNYKLDSKKPVDSLRFFYTIRCNVVHRGKILMYDDDVLLRNSLEDLYEIFKNVLDNTFGDD